MQEVQVESTWIIIPVVVNIALVGLHLTLDYLHTDNWL